jgi:class 3 adenylate cyclase
VIGDAVNTASRVEAATRETGDDVLITGATRALLHGVPCELVERSGIELKGKSEPVRLWGCRPAGGRFRRAGAGRGELV